MKYKATPQDNPAPVYAEIQRLRETRDYCTDEARTAKLGEADRLRRQAADFEAQALSLIATLHPKHARRFHPRPGTPLTAS